MVGKLFDSCVLIDHLRGVAAARDVLSGQTDPAISVVTWVEVLVGATPETEMGTRAFLAGFEVVPLDEPVAEAAVLVRRSQRLRLPDAIVLASARVAGRILVTRDDAFAGVADVSVPYRL